MRAIKLQVIGKVQGVFFRKSTLQKAQSLNLNGWVQNEADGSVSILAQGPNEFLDIFIAWCHHGPREAEVQKVILEDLEDASLYSLENFEIKR